MTPRPRAGQQPPDPHVPDHHMQPNSMSPDDTEDHHEEQQQKGPDRTATPLPLPPPKDIYATLASTLAEPMDAEQYYQQVLQEVPASHLALQGCRQEKVVDNDWGPGEDLHWEDT